MDAIKIIIVDDHTIIVDGLRATLSCVDDIVITGDAPDADSLFSLLENQLPDIILLDVTLPGISGIEITDIIANRYPTVKVIILSADAGRDLVSAAIAAGAKGYLTKDTGHNELIEAIRNVYHGKDYIGTKISGAIIGDYIINIRQGAGSNLHRGPRLSERELQIIKLLAEGLSQKEIGKELCISARTVETHKNNLMLKLDLKTLADIIRFAIRHRITHL